MKISNRLKRVACNVTLGYRVADIGTDHGYVPIYLVENQLAVHVIAMDINEGPLKRANENIRNSHLESFIETRLSNGFEKLSYGEADIAVIAGMGGELMKSLLKNGAHVVSGLEELVLSPHSEIHVVREYIRCIGHKIVNEEMLVDEGKYYTIIKTHKGQEDTYSATEYKYGKILIDRRDVVLMDYLKYKKDKFLSILENFETQKIENDSKSWERYRQIKVEVEEIEGILKG